LFIPRQVLLLNYHNSLASSFDPGGQICHVVSSTKQPLVSGKWWCKAADGFGNMRGRGGASASRNVRQYWETTSMSLPVAVVQYCSRQGRSNITYVRIRARPNEGLTVYLGCSRASEDDRRSWQVRGVVFTQTRERSVEGLCLFKSRD